MRHGAVTPSMRLCGPLRRHVVSPIGVMNIGDDALCAVICLLGVNRCPLVMMASLETANPPKKNSHDLAQNLQFPSCVYDEERTMCTASPAVVDVFRCIDSIKVSRLLRVERSLPTPD